MAFTDFTQCCVLRACQLNGNFAVALQNAYQDLENSIIDVQKDIDNTTTYTSSFEYKVVDKYSDSNGKNNTVSSSTYCCYCSDYNILLNLCGDWQECYITCCVYHDASCTQYAVATYCHVYAFGSGGDDACACWVSCNFDNFSNIDLVRFNVCMVSCSGSIFNISCYKFPCVNCIICTSSSPVCTVYNCYEYKRINSSSFDIYCNNNILCCCVSISDFSYTICSRSEANPYSWGCVRIYDLFYGSLETNQFCVNKTTTQSIDLIAVKVTDLLENYDNITFEVKDSTNSLGTACADADGNAILTLCCATCTPCVFICSGSSSLNQLCSHGIKYFHC